MKSGKWFAIITATIVWTLALWFGFISMPSQRSVSLAIIAIGLVFSMYVLAGFGGGSAPMDVGFKAALTAVIVALVLLVLTGITGLEMFAVAAPIVGAGTGAAFAIPPVGDLSRAITRIAFVGALAIIMVWLWGADHTVYGATAPLFVFVVVAIADLGYDRSQQVLAEE